MHSRDETEIAWVAGIFEGEGCIQLYRPKNGNYFYCQLELVSTDFDIINRVRNIAGYGTIRVDKRSQKNKQWRDAYRLYICKRENVFDFLNHIYEWLGERRTAKVDEVFEKCVTPERSCYYCGKMFKPGIDRKRNAITCSEPCGKQNKNEKTRIWHKTNDKERRKMSRRMDERATKD